MIFHGNHLDSHENHALFLKLRKMLLNLSSAASVIGPLRVNNDLILIFLYFRGHHSEGI